MISVGAAGVGGVTTRCRGGRTIVTVIVSLYPLVQMVFFADTRKLYAPGDIPLTVAVV